MLNFKLFERTERVELGTVATLGGKGGKVRFIPGNIANKAVRVALIIEKKNGTSDVVACSPQVSQKLRDHEITLAHVLGFPIIEFTSTKGTSVGQLINLIVMPSTVSNLPEIEIDKVKIEEYEPEAISTADLVAQYL